MGERLKTARIAWPDAARGIAIILVVLHHAIQYAFEAHLVAVPWLEATNFLKTMRMPLFFMTAGLFAGKWMLKPWRDLLKSKVMLLVWVYSLWVVIRWAWFNLIPGDDIESGPLALVVHLVLPNGGWFLAALAIFFVIARATVSVNRYLQLGVAAALSIVWFSGIAGQMNIAVEGVFLYYVFFLFGCYWRDLVTVLAAKTNLAVRVAVILVWPALYAILKLLDLENAPVINFTLRIVGLAAGISLAVILSRVQPLRFLGQKTLPIYVAHSMFLFATIQLLELIGVEGWPAEQWWLPLPVAALALTAALGLGLVAPKIHAAWLFEKPRWLDRAYDRAWPSQRVETATRRRSMS